MYKRKLTAFGIEVKKALLENGETLNWLIEEVKKDTGLFLDSGYMNKILTGQRNPEKIVNSICKILDICP